MNKTLPSIYVFKKNDSICGKIVDSSETILDEIRVKVSGKYLDAFIKCSVVFLKEGKALCCLILNGQKSEFTVLAESHFIDIKHATLGRSDFLKVRDFAENYNLSETEFLFKPKWFNLTFSPQISDFGFEEIRKETNN
jgi:hypothetical protein